MKDVIILLSIFFLSCSSNQINNVVASTIELNDSVVYSNKEYKIILYYEHGRISKYELSNSKNNFKFLGEPVLVTIDGKIPEGTNRIDYNNPNDIRGYFCDSTYQYISDSINVSFAIEKSTRIRLDLSIYDSNNENFTNGDYTLLRGG